MEKILIVKYDFPPDGGQIAQRIVTFIKEYGYNLIDLTFKHKPDIKDETLIEDIPDDIILWD